MREQTGAGAEDPRIAKGTKTNTETLAEAADIGLIYLGEIERGVKMPSLKTFIKLVNALDVSADELIGLETKPGRDYYAQKLSEQLQSLTQEETAAVLSILETTIQQVKNLRNETV
ncbi:MULTISPECIES: helix-turn-helix domain-containing protein [unclassified Butyricicoccus]|uniref:helix-turn-helix domain-containing protein n=1 Tax=unclassified Butyricicoccus TaxID=2633649 RepID=UPI001FA96FFC|nr:MULTISPECIES: helix-turn-helix transcriptional regulator [unclassified Butyricicoccus]